MTRRRSSKYKPDASTRGRARWCTPLRARQPFRVRSAPTEVPDTSAQRAAFATALLVTGIELGVLSLVLSPRPHAEQHEEPPVAAERVVFVVPSRSSAHVAELRASPSTLATSVGLPAARPVATRTTPRDSSVRSVPVPYLSAAPVVAPPPGSRTGTGGTTTAGPVLAPRGFTPSAPITRRVIDSVLDSLNAYMPALIWARVPTRAERDSAYKESVVAMRLSGRALLVPADPHLVSGLGLPSFFSRRKHREAARAGTDSSLAENMARLARLRERAQHDSLRRDSLQRADSIRRADSLAAATPRRLPDARTPA